MSMRIATFLLALIGFVPHANAQPVITSSSDLGTWSVGVINGQGLSAAGGTAPYTWTLVSGMLPPGVSIRTDLPSHLMGGPSSAALVGVATTPGLYPFRIRVTDSNALVAEQDILMRISSLIVKDQFSLPHAFIGQPYAYTLTAMRSGVPVTATWAAQSGFPAGITLDPSTGALAGTPTVAGSYFLRMNVTQGGETIWRDVFLDVFDVRITNPASLPNATRNVLYVATLSADGGTSPYTFASSDLPSGLTLDPSGTLAGTITRSDVYRFSVTATDSQGRAYAKRMSLAVVGAPPALPAIVPFGNAFDDCTLNWPCSRGLRVFAGGIGPFTWTATGLPAGMSIRSGASGSPSYFPSDGEIWGSPAQLGPYSVTVTVTDSTGASATNTFPLQVGDMALANNVNTTWTRDVAGTQYLRVLGGPSLPAIGVSAPNGSGPGSTLYSAAALSGQPPAGVLFATAPPGYSGTPTENISATTRLRFTHTVTGASIDASYFFSVGGGPVQISTSSDLGVVTSAAAYSRQLLGCCAPSGLTWDVVSGTLPTGLFLSPSGLLSGNPTQLGTRSFLVQATDNGNPANFGRRQLTISVTNNIFTSTTSLLPGNVGTFYSSTLTSFFAGTWSLEPLNYLPPGLTLSSGGVLSGIPTQSGQYLFVVRNSTGPLLGTFTVSIYPAGVTPPVSFSLSPQGPFPLGPRLIQLTGATGGSGAGYQYSLTPGAPLIPGFRVQNGAPLPTSFPASVTAGLLGVATTPGVHQSSIRVTDSVGNFFDAPVSVSISPLNILSSTTLPKAVVGSFYAFTLMPSGGSLYSWSATGLPAGLSIDSATGTIAGTPTSAGTVNVPVTITDLAAPIQQPITQTFTLTVDPFAITNAGVLPTGIVGVPYGPVTLTTPGCSGTCTWSTIAGLPAGLTFDISTGVISGTPTAANNANFTVTQTSSGGTTNGMVQKIFALQVVASTPQPVQITLPGQVSYFTIGNAVSSALFASGGQPPYSWTLDSGTLPPGVSLEGPGETVGWLIPGFTYLLGRGTQVGVFTFTLRVTDVNGASATRTFIWTISPLSAQYTNLPPAGGQLPNGIPFSGQLLVVGGSAAEGLGGYAWSNTGPLPYNLTLDPATGTVSGTPTEAGFFSVGTQALDPPTGQTLVFNVGLNIAGSTTVSFGANSNLGQFQQGMFVNQNLNISGGTAPYAVTALTPLPPGFALITGNSAFSSTPANAVFLAGMPLSSGVFTFTLQAQDSSATPNVRQRTFTMTVTPFTLAITSVLPDGAVGQPYAHTLLTTNITGPTTWSVASGSSLPPGLTLAGGVISGTPTVAANSYSFVLTATDASGLVRNTTFTLRVSSVGMTDPQVLPVVAVAGTPFSYTFTSTGAATWTVQGALPNGLTLSSSGVLSGTTAGTFANTITITATPAGGVAHTRRFTLYSKAQNPLVLDFPYASTALVDVTVGQSAIIALGPSGGSPPYSWSVAPGSTLPPGFSLTAAAAQGSPLSGSLTPGGWALTGAGSLPGAYIFDLILTDSAGTQARRTFTLNISPLSILFASTPPFVASIKAGTIGVPYAHQFVAVGGTAPHSFSMSPVSLTQDMLPPGLTMTASGLISGTPTSTGNYAFFLRVEDAAGRTFTRRTTLAVTNALNVLVTNVNPQDTPIGIGRRANLALQTSGGPATTYSWSVAPGSVLPPGFQLVMPPIASGPTLGGAAQAAGTFTFALRATDTANSANVVDHTFTVRVAPMQFVEPAVEGAVGANLPAGQVGIAYSTVLKMAGGTAPYSFALSPFTPLPPGLSLSAGGVISGTPVSPGNTTVNVIGTDGAGFVLNSIALTLVVTPAGAPPPLGRLGALPVDASVGVPYNTNLDVLLSGGTRPFTWSLSAGSSLPPGLTLLPGSNGVGTYLGGMPTVAGETTVSFDIVDAGGQSLTSLYTVRVSPLALTPDTLPPGRVGVPYQITLTPAGGTGPYAVFAQPLFNLPPGLTLDPSGVLQGVPTHAGNFPMVLFLEDAAGNGLERLYRFTVDNAAGEAPAVSLTPTPIQLFHTTGSADPAPTQVAVNATSGSFPFGLSLTGIPGASLSQRNGTATSTVNIDWNLAGVAIGSYHGVLGVRADQSVNRVDQVPVTLTVAAPPPCSYSLTSSSGSAAAAGGSGSVGIAAASSCAWTASPGVPWIMITGASSGAGSATLHFTVTPNGGVAPRTGTIDVEGTLYSLTQFGSSCSFAISPGSLSAPVAGGTAVVNIAASDPSCSWSASSVRMGIAPLSGTGNGTVTVTVPQNATAPMGDMLTATIAGQPFTVNQAGFNCYVLLSPYEASSPAAGGSGSVVVTPAAGCSYDTAGGPSWVSVTSGGSGTGPATLVYEVQPNSTTFSRSGTLMIGGQAFRITQEGLACSVTLDTSNLGSPYGSGSGNVGTIDVIANGPNCSWVAKSAAPWATVLPASGSGNQTLQVSVTANSGAATPRTADLAVAGQVVSITQAGAACTYGLQSTTGAVPAPGGQGAVGVIAPASCGWSAVSDDPSWLTVVSAGSMGTSNVVFSALPNPAATPRVGTLTIQSLTFTVTQAPASCSYTLDTPGLPLSSVGVASATFGFSTITVGCSAPTAVSYSDWVTIANTSFGGSAGSVVFSVQANPTATSRQATIQLGDKNFTVSQAGAACGYSLASYGSTFAQAGGAGSVQASASGLGCSPDIGITQSFISLDSVGGGSPFSVNFNVSPYVSLNLSVRFGQVIISGRIHTVKQTSW